MNEHITTKKLNSSQLSVEMGRIGLRVVGPYEDGSYKVKTDEATEDALRAAIEAHVADDAWVDPDPPPPPPEEQERQRKEARLKELRAKTSHTPTEAREYQDLLANWLLGE